MEELNEKIDGLTMSAEVSAENDSDEMSFEVVSRRGHNG